MRLSLRTRLILWSTAFTLVILLIVSAVVLELHERQGLAELDAGVDAALQTVAAVMRNELDEGLALPLAAADALSELDIPGVGLALLDGTGTTLGIRVADRIGVPPDLGGHAGDSLHTTESGARFRLRVIRTHYRGQDYGIAVWRPYAPFEADRRAVRRALLLTLPLVLLLSATGGWLLGWRALRPLAAMAHQAGRMNHRRLEERLVYPANGDELSVLGGAFNQLLDRLAGALHEQRSFMADASHQLRTPLSIARMAAEVTMSQAERAPDEYRDALRVIADQTQRLTRIVDDMFVLALADADARPLRMQRLDLEELVHAPVRAARVLAQPKGVIVRSLVDGCEISGDEELLRQLLLNLLENAVRYSPEGGSVELHCVCDQSVLFIRVRDRGTGIPEADWERIFERFVRLDAVTRDGGGGLGLPIARWIAELHGGTVRVVSSGARGTTFEAQLPVSGKS